MFGARPRRGPGRGHLERQEGVKTRANWLCVSRVGGWNLWAPAGNPGWWGIRSLPGWRKASIPSHFLHMCSSENPCHHFFLPSPTHCLSWIWGLFEWDLVLVWTCRTKFLIFHGYHLQVKNQREWVAKQENVGWEGLSACGTMSLGDRTLVLLQTGQLAGIISCNKFPVNKLQMGLEVLEFWEVQLSGWLS